MVNLNAYVLIALANFFQVTMHKLILPDDYSGWVHVVIRKDMEKTDYYNIDARGVVYVPKLGPNDSIMFKLYSTSRLEIGKNVKLFGSVESRKDSDPIPKNYYVFYYPSMEELKYDESYWSDQNVFNKYHKLRIDAEKRLEEEGVFN